MIKKKEGYKGYCTHQPFNGNQIPIPGQNAVLRDYTRRQNLMFKLSNNEMNFPRCHLVLNSLLDQLPHLEGIVMTSVFMLPLDSEERWKIYDRVLEENCEMHCVFENLVVDFEGRLGGAPGASLMDGRLWVGAYTFLQSQLV